MAWRLVANLFTGRRADALQNTIQRGNWTIYFFADAYWSMGVDYRSYEYVLLGNSRCAVLRADTPKILEGADVDRGLRRTLEAMMEHLSDANDGSLQVVWEGDTLDSAGLSRWLSELIILRFQLMLPSLGGEAP